MFAATVFVSNEIPYALSYCQVWNQNGLAGIPLVMSECGDI